MTSATRTPEPTRRYRSKIVLIGFATFGALAAAEIALRVLGLPAPAQSFQFLGSMLSDDETFVTDDVLFWKLKPDPPFTNRLGLRGYLPDGDGADALRVVCVGDSCTYGAHVRYEESYGIVLDRKLREAMPGRDIETILAGVPGWTTYQNRVLFERDITPLRPDVTVLYCGGYNDYVPAIGASDRERLSGLHLSRLLRDVSAELDEEERLALWAEAPHGRRVPLEQFQDNMRAMIATARSVDSHVIVVMPPLDVRWYAGRRIASRYRASVEAIASEAGVPLLDGPGVFSDAVAEVEVSDRAHLPGEWPCLIDWVHPSVFGHRRIADRLFELLVEANIVEPGGAAAADAPTVTAVDPPRAEQGSAILVRGTGFAARRVQRVFAGRFWLADFEVLDDTTIRATLPLGMPSGFHPLKLAGTFGSVTSAASVEVPAPALIVEVAQVDDGVGIGARCAGPRHWQFYVWWSTTLRETPVATRHGQLGLAFTPDGRPPAHPDTPFVFERQPPLFEGVLDDDGRWESQTTLPAASAADLPDVLHLQGLVVEPGNTGRACLTDVIRVRIR